MADQKNSFGRGKNETNIWNIHSRGQVCRNLGHLNGFGKLANRCPWQSRRCDLAHKRVGVAARSLIFPSGKSVACVCGLSSPACKNISLNPSGKSRLLASPVPSERGALAIVTNVGRDAVDAAASQDERRQCVRRRSCGPAPRRWRQVLEGQPPRATVANKSGHRGTKQAVKTIAQGRPDRSANLW